MVTNILSMISNINTHVYQYTYNYIYEFMDKKDLEQLLNCKTLDELFVKSFNYGVLPIILFLYEHKNIKYNNSLLVNFNCNMVTELVDDSMVSATTQASNTQCRVQIIDKYYNSKAVCYNYLQYMKRYSLMSTSNKNFYYKLKRHVNTDQYIRQWIK